MLRLNFAGNEICLLSSGLCYWPQQKTLIVADLHLEKGSYFALRGQPIPLADTRSTLEKLQQEIENLAPEAVLCLGDNVHDAEGFLRMQEEDLLLLDSLCKGVARWTWIIGNHDTRQLKAPALGNMHFVLEERIANLYFRHTFEKDKDAQVIGHYHPKISVRRQGLSMTGKCFVAADNILIMPAFGQYTGGLDITDKVYQAILPEKKQYYLLFQDSIYFVK